MSVLVFAESTEGKFKKIAFEAISYGKKVAGQMNTSLSVLTVNAGDTTELSNYGAEKIIKVTNGKLATFNAKAYANVVSQVAGKENAQVIIIDASANGLYLAPFVSVNLNAGYASNVVGAPSSTAPFKVKRKAFSNKAFSNIEINTPTKVIGLAKNSFGLIENKVS
ncbi:MAG: electron transfer flavoprotein subunit alpha/FixB family protein, partial [Flavobacteriaceae bacterium]|nr:electron transfer flavoprotein subunit alpha/FixB family protein [Flavobacteriaceae bacterium]